jgi:DNA polymerase-1
MKRTLLIFDMHYLAWRAYHTTGELSYKGVRTGVVFGVLRDMVDLQDTFMSTHTACCFDCGRIRRKDIYEGYKKKRHTRSLTEEEQKGYDEVRRQIYLLRCLYLNKIGYANVLWANGFESDDIIAGITRNLPDRDEAVIVSADKDLYQLLRPNVSLYNPAKRHTTTLQSFFQAYGIKPRQWARVLAIAGCKTDEVPGIPGIAVKSAVAYLRGELGGKRYDRIRAGRQQMLFNRRLVELPFEDTPEFELMDDHFTRDGWARTLEFLGIKHARAPRSMRATLWNS